MPLEPPWTSSHSPATSRPRSNTFVHTVKVVSGSAAAATKSSPAGSGRHCCQGAAQFSLSAPNVRGALEQIERRYPSLYRSICDETGAVRRHVNLFVNSAHVRDREGLDTALVAGDVVTIMPAVSGG